MFPAEMTEAERKRALLAHVATGTAMGGFSGRARFLGGGTKYMYMLYTALLATASKIRPSSLGIYTIRVEMPQRPKGTQTSSYTVSSVTYWVSA